MLHKCPNKNMCVHMKIAIIVVHYLRMKRNTILKKRNVYWIEETPKLSITFRKEKLGQAKTILHGKSANLKHKFFQRELIKRGAVAENVEVDVLRFLKKVRLY